MLKWGRFKPKITNVVKDWIIMSFENFYTRDCF